ncbi:sulfotransferase [Halomonas sp. M20]|uniref:sulfotransferase n=1 Tax=Halomonas sp. M20 TaxID=2763264 RepID=UPI001D0AF102|nr:sulfotransferase [Halomonas sp. M20]
MAELVFVIGSGRSGTSLASQILGKLGGRISNELVPVGEQNPDGAYEDKFVFDTITQLMRELGATHNLPMPEGWLEASATRACINALVDKVNAEAKLEGGPWILKEPRSAILLPMWRKVFNRTKVAPKYVLTLRDPKNVCVSSFKQYGEPVEVTELMWLNKYVSALGELSVSSYLLHYESWFTNPVETSRDLAEYVGLSVDEVTLKSIVSETVKPRLNRSDFLGIELKNPCVTNLYHVLQACNGLDYRRDQLKGALQQAIASMDAFSGWVQLYYAKKTSAQPADKEKKDLKKLTREFEKAKYDLADALQRESQLLAKLESEQANQQNINLMATKLVEATQSMQKTEKALREKTEEIKALRVKLNKVMKRYDIIVSSTSYQLSQVFANMVRSPLRGFFLLPVNLFSVLKKWRSRGN